MSRFKYKKQKPILSDSRKTVSARHQEMMDRFEDERTKILPAKERQLDNLRKKLTKFDKPSDKMNTYDRDVIFSIRKEISKLEEQIQVLEKRQNENKYHLKTAKLLSEYMKHIEKPGKKSITPCESVSEPTLVNQNQKAILSFFRKPAGSKTESSSSEDSAEDVLPAETKDFLSSINKGRKRGEILDAYMRAVDENYVPDIKYRQKGEGCTGCGEKTDIEYDFQLGKNVCGKCGKQLDYFFDPHFTSYKQSSEIDIQPEFPYKRINHFFECQSLIKTFV